MLKTVKDELQRSPEDINVMSITWNTARKTQNPSLDLLIPKPENYDLLMICIQEGKKIETLIKRLDTHLAAKGLRRMAFTS